MAGVTFRSGQLAKATGVSADTIRHYERIGVLPSPAGTVSGYRLYHATAVNRVLVVQRALRIGVTLADFADIFNTRDAGGTPCRRVFELAKTKLTAIEADIAALTETRRQLLKILADWQMRITTYGDQKAHLLQSLTKAVNDSRRSKFRRKR